MRILIVCHHAPPHVGGLENLVSLEARSLRDAGHDVNILTTRPFSDSLANPRLPLDADDPCPVARVPACHLIERIASIAYPFPAPSFVTTLRRLARNADLVHVHGFVFPPSIIAAIALPRRTPLILTDHGGILHYRSRTATFALRIAIETAGRYVTRRARTAIAYNSSVERLLRRLAATPDRVAFLPNPVDTSVFHPVDTSARQAIRKDLGWDDRPRILFAGRLVDDKGINTLAQAADPAYELVFVGPGPSDTIDRLRRVAEVLPPRPQQDLADLYRVADAFALPSWNEGFPVVIQEALCCGCPVVTTDTPAYDRYRPLVGLSFCEPKPEPFRDRLRELINTPSDQHAIATDAAAFFGDPASWADRLLNLATRPTSSPDDDS